MPVPAETEKRPQTITTPKEAKPVIKEAKPIIIPRQNPVPKAELVHKQKSTAAVVQTQRFVPSKTVGARPTTRNRFIDWIIKLVDLVDSE